MGAYVRGGGGRRWWWGCSPVDPQSPEINRPPTPRTLTLGSREGAQAHAGVALSRGAQRKAWGSERDALCVPWEKPRRPPEASDGGAPAAVAREARQPGGASIRSSRHYTTQQYACSRQEPPFARTGPARTTPAPSSAQCTPRQQQQAKILQQSEAEQASAYSRAAFFAIIF